MRRQRSGVSEPSPSRGKATVAIAISCGVDVEGVAPGVHQRRWSASQRRATSGVRLERQTTSSSSGVTSSTSSSTAVDAVPDSTGDGMSEGSAVPARGPTGACVVDCANPASSCVAKGIVCPPGPRLPRALQRRGSRGVDDHAPRESRVHHPVQRRERLCGERRPRVDGIEDLAMQCNGERARVGRRVCPVDGVHVHGSGCPCLCGGTVPAVCPRSDRSAADFGGRRRRTFEVRHDRGRDVVAGMPARIAAKIQSARARPARASLHEPVWLGTMTVRTRGVRGAEVQGSDADRARRRGSSSAHAVRARARHDVGAFAIEGHH